MARPPGSRNRSNLRVKALIARMDRAGRINLARCIETLYEIGTSDDAPDRIPALRTLLGYAYGLPRMSLEVEHGLTKTAEQILLEIARSEAHSRALARVEEHRRLTAGAVTVAPEGEAPS